MLDLCEDHPPTLRVPDLAGSASVNVTLAELIWD